MAAEMKIVKKRTGKLFKSVDTVQGDMKRSSQGLDALNKTLTVVGAGAERAVGVGAVQVAGANGNPLPDFFPGQRQRAIWVKSMVACFQCCRVSMLHHAGNDVAHGTVSEVWSPLHVRITNAPRFVFFPILCCSILRHSSSLAEKYSRGACYQMSRPAVHVRLHAQS